MRALLCLGLMLCLVAGVARADGIQITAAHNVLADFAKRIGGDDVDVWMPAPEGRDPALWKPSIQEISRIQRSDLILLNGASYAGWTAKTSLPRAKTVITAKAFEDRWIGTEGSVTHSHGPDGEHAHAGTDPHTWLDFSQAAQQARAIGAALAKPLPQTAEQTEALAAELDALHERMLGIAANIRGPIIASHPRYAYFARAYGLSIASLDWPAGEEPAPERLQELETLLGDTAPGIFLWEAAPSDTAEQAVDAIGLKSLVLETGALNGSDFLASSNQLLDALEAHVSK